MDVRLLALVELGRELLLLEELGHAARRGDVARGERRQRRRVHVLGVAARGDELAVLVDDEDDPRVRVFDEAIHHVLDLVELLLVHHHLGVDHYVPPPASAVLGRACRIMVGLVARAFPGLLRVVVERNDSGE